MSKRYEGEKPFNPAGLATGSILALIIAMAVSLAFDIPATDTGDFSVAVPATAQVASAHG